jgi:hypothetical protein
MANEDDIRKVAQAKKLTGPKKKKPSPSRNRRKGLG